MVSTDLSVGLQGQAAFPAASSGARSAHHDGLLLPAGHLDYLRRGGALPPADLGSAQLVTKLSSPAAVILGLLAVLVATVRLSVAATVVSPPATSLPQRATAAGKPASGGKLRLLIHAVPDH